MNITDEELEVVVKDDNGDIEFSLDLIPIMVGFLIFGDGKLLECRTT